MYNVFSYFLFFFYYQKNQIVYKRGKKVTIVVFLFSGYYRHRVRESGNIKECSG
ncbi:Uncharacterised protein [Bacteroides faecis]|uniref:Uncharacterized protein n=1 Tax=Bacteroides faecis TaxID=674529 RepID=A0A6N2UIM9_9BACE